MSIVKRKAIMPTRIALVLTVGLFAHCSALVATLANTSTAGDGCFYRGKFRRLAWLHIPKTGTSFGTSIAHYLHPGFPPDVVVPDCARELCTHVDRQALGHIEFQHRYPPDTWFPGCIWLKAGHGPNNMDWFAHHQVHQRFWQRWEGSFVGFFRDPSQRAISSWDSFAGAASKSGKMLNKEEWARHIEGTATKMLAGQENPTEIHRLRDGPSLVVPDVELALSRINGFLFVGLVEHWALSICLFHRITSSTCTLHELDNMRSNRKRDYNESWDTSELNGYIDSYDTEVYHAVKQRFWRDVKKYEATQKNCRKLCRYFPASSFVQKASSG
eukprot:TRINITY_DN2711_c0_g1_i1.p1 TRINITY_DN2711_c0_g1~~TRINITY_DN2711_c0_g1_i1.p1  ORF type:complete len:329 (-),score=31.62 TRINITY_DN2711_c0_g1_i1:23-1009(-)